MGRQLYGGGVWWPAPLLDLFSCANRAWAFFCGCVGGWGGGVRLLFLARLTARADARCDVVLSPDAARLGEPRGIVTLSRTRRRDLAKRAP